MNLVFKRAADQDLVEAATWYNEQQAHLGEVFLERVAAKLALIRDFPFVGPLVYRDIRRATVAPYRYSIFYLIDEQRDRIVIMKVEHDSRDPGGIQRRLESDVGD